MVKAEKGGEQGAKRKTAGVMLSMLARDGMDMTGRASCSLNTGGMAKRQHISHICFVEQANNLR